MQQILEFSANHPLLVGGFLAIATLLIAGEVRRMTRGFPVVSAIRATELLNHEDAVFLDIREQSEFSDGHILNTLHIPADAIDDRIKELEKYRDRPIIVYCATGSRSLSVCASLFKRGFEKVTNLGGGLQAWKTANLPVTSK